MRRLLALFVAVWRARMRGDLPPLPRRALRSSSATAPISNAPALANPMNDARDMAAALKSVGFDVVEALDADRRKLDGAMRVFTDKLANADVALFFYAGHGLQVGAQNYLVPIDAKLERERDLEFETVKLDFVLRQMEIEREGKTTIVILDACRDNPLTRNLARSMGTRSAGIGRGLAAASTGLGTFIAYSTQPGNVALDGQGRNSPFTAALVKHMADKGHNLPATMIEVRKEVVAATGGAQVPWDHSALTGDFYFAPGAAAPSPGTVASAPAGTGADRRRAAGAPQEARGGGEATGSLGQPRSHRPRRGRVPPVIPKPAIAKESPSFQIEENVRIDGLKYSDERQPNPAACRESCEQDARCVAFQHGRRSPMMGQCQLFSRIDARHQDASWRSGVRTDAARPTETGLLPSILNRLTAKIVAPLTRKEKGFDVYEGVAVMGDQLKMSATDSSCRLPGGLPQHARLLRRHLQRLLPRQERRLPRLPQRHRHHARPDLDADDPRRVTGKRRKVERGLSNPDDGISRERLRSAPGRISVRRQCPPAPQSCRCGRHPAPS